MRGLGSGLLLEQQRKAGLGSHRLNTAASTSAALPHPRLVTAAAAAMKTTITALLLCLVFTSTSALRSVVQLALEGSKLVCWLLVSMLGAIIEHKHSAQ